MNPTKDTTVGTVELTAAAELRLQSAVRRLGGVVSTTGQNSAAEAVAGALEAVQRTLAVLEHVLEPELPPIYQDRVPRC